MKSLVKKMNDVTKVSNEPHDFRLLTWVNESIIACSKCGVIKKNNNSPCKGDLKVIRETEKK